ncbi:MAG TPA: serine hydrolase [Pirellulaceae bacterium]|nr:serine hydrolase [Pirellulaceae bacterium]
MLLWCAVVTAQATDERKAVEAVATKALDAVPGDSAFVFTRVLTTTVEPLYGVHAEQRLAVGSSFKLFILGRLIDDVNTGRRRLSDTMVLQRTLHGPPQSEMASWPVGSPVALHTLALKMIWISDNTATDHLHFLLGRERIEQQMQAMGHGDPSVNRPLLSTREMTILRDKKLGSPGIAYQKMTEGQKRAYLAKQFGTDPDYAQLDFDTNAYKLAEWYASPLDMAQSLAWIYHNTGDAKPAHALRAVLTVDPKLKYDPAVWTFVGFKGGSEDQLLAGNWLLRHRNGNWYTFHCYFNNPEGEIKPEQVLPVMETILRAIEPTLEKAKP